MNRQIKLFSAAMALALAGTASAATSWTLNTGSVTIGGVTVTATGWANTGSGSPVGSQLLEQQTLSLYGGGFGITNKDACGTSPCDVSEGNTPEHAIDNNERYEMVLLSFSQAVKLQSVKMGWTSNDSDISVMAYNGPGTGSSSLSGNTWAGVASAWTSIGNYSDVGTASKAVNGGGVSSSYWLIGAYNPLANPGGGSVTVPSSGNYFDYVKLASVTTSPGGSAPLPGTLLLLGTGLLGMLSMRKRLAA